jgi:TPP-dependent pyruvate/acetoin dehydrogenase alpha subunit
VTLIEALTYRQKGHSRSDPGTYRPDGELDVWLERDPIKLHVANLADAGVAQEQLAAVRAKAETAVTDALARALSWPEADPASRLEDVFA